MAVVGDKHPQGISEAKPDNFTESQLPSHNGNHLSRLCETFIFQIYSGHKHLSSCHNLLSCVFMAFDWIIWQVSMGSSRGNVSFPQWVYRVLSQKLASDLWASREEWWTALGPWLSRDFS